MPRTFCTPRWQHASEDSVSRKSVHIIRTATQKPYGPSRHLSFFWKLVACGVSFKPARNSLMDMGPDSASKETDSGVHGGESSDNQPLKRYKRYMEVVRKYCPDRTENRHLNKLATECLAARSRMGAMLNRIGGKRRSKRSKSYGRLDFPKLDAPLVYGHYNKNTKLWKVICRTCRLWVGHVKMTSNSAGFEFKHYKESCCTHFHLTAPAPAAIATSQELPSYLRRQGSYLQRAADFNGNGHISSTSSGSVHRW